MKKRLLLYIFIFASGVGSYAQIPASHLQLWLKADSVEIISGKIATWYDQSGNNYSPIQTNATNRPSKVDNALSEKPVIRFSGTNWLKYQFPSAITQPLTTFVIWKVSTAGSYRFCFDNYSTSYFGVYGTNTTVAMQVGGSKIFYTKSVPFNYILNTSLFNTTSSKLFENGVLQGSGSVASNSLTGISVGNAYNSSGPFIGDIAEIIMYDTVLSVNDRVTVENYLMDKYSPSLDLGSDITVNYGFCDTMLDIDQSFNNILWSTGSSNDTIFVNQSGQYWVQATDNFGRLRTDTINVQFPNPNFQNTNICLGDSISYEPVLIGSYSYIWSDLTSDALKYYKNEGDYWLRMEDDYACFDTVFFSVDVDSFKNEIWLGNDTSLCSGNTIQLITGEGLCSSFLWTPGDITDSFQTVDISGWQKIEVENENGCTATDSIFATIVGTAPVPDYIVNNLCFGETTQFIDNSTPSGDIAYWKWVINTSDTIYTQNAEWQFNTIGIQSIELIVESLSGCSNNLLFNIEIKDIPTVSFNYLPVCANVTAEFISSIETPPTSSISSVSWYINNVLTSNDVNLTHSFDSSGDYEIKLIAELDNLCSTTYIETIHIPESYPLAEQFALMNPPPKVYSFDVNFIWSQSANSIFFKLIVATDSDFINTLYSIDSIFNTNYEINFDEITDTIFWKVIAYNPCLTETSSEISQFTYFSPNLVSDLYVWISADSVELIGGKVATWYDQSGNNFSPIQTNATNRPTKVDNALAEQPVIRFSGTNWLKYQFPSEILQPVTVFAVWNVTTPGPYRFCFGNYSTNYFALYSTNTTVEMYTSSKFNYIKSVPFKYLLNSTVFNTTSSKLYENGVLMASGNVGTNTLKGLTIGNSYQGIYPLIGDIAEIIMYDTVLSVNDRVIVENYLMDKYSPNLDLGPDITVNYGFCDTMLNIDQSFNNILWSTGSTNDTIFVNKSGEYWVQTLDNFGRLRTDTINVQFPNPNISNSNVCLGDSVLYQPNLIGSYSYIWSDFTTDALKYYKNEGGYWLRMEDDYACFDTVFFSVAVDSFKNEIWLGNDTSLCSGNTIQLITGEGLCSSFLWTPGDITDSFQTVDVSGWQKIEVENENGCTATDSIFATIVGTAPVPDYIVTNLCFGEITQFIDNSTPPGDIASCKWIINSNDTIYTQNAEWQFSTIGTQSIELIVESFSGCSNNLVFDIEIQAIPSASFSYLPVCTNVPAEFISSIETPLTSSISSVSWYINNVLTSNDVNLTHSFGNPGDYEIKLIAELDNLCSATYIDTIHIPLSYPQPEQFALTHPLSKVYSFDVNFIWSQSDNAIFYKLIVATDSDFINTSYSIDSIFNTNYEINFDEITDTIFWKVIAYNPCLSEITSEIANFTYFSPDLVSDLYVWISADSVELIGGKVATWYDQSGNNYSPIQTNATNRPTKIDNALAEQPVIRFSGTNWLKYQFPSEILQPVTVFAVWNVTTSGSYRFCFGNYSTNYFALYSTNTFVEMYTSFKFNYIKSVPFNYLLNSTIFNTTSSKLYENGVLMASGNVGTNTLNGLTIGNSYQGIYPLIGDIAEIILYDTVISNEDRIDVENYLMHKYSPPVNLSYDIRIPYGFCDTAITTAYKPWFTAYEWSTGETDSIIHVNKPGLYSVTVTDIFGFESSDDIRVFYPDVNEFTDTIVCLGETVIWDLELAGDYAYEWYGSEETLQALTIATEGEYAAILTDTVGCKYYTDTITFSLDQYEFTTSLGPNDTSLCSGNILLLVENAEETNTYNWSTGSSDSEIVLSSGGEYSVSVTSDRGCEAIDTINVTIIGIVPTPDLLVENLCLGDATQLLDNSTPLGDIVSWKWIINENDTLYTQNTEWVFETTGTQQIELIIEALSGCGNSSEFEIEILDVPEVNFTYSTICSGVEMAFIPDVIVPENTVVSQYNWFVDSFYSDSETVFNYIFDPAGSYNISLEVVLDNSCSSSFSEIVDVIETYPLPEYLSLIFPENEYNIFSSNPEIEFIWNNATNLNYYKIQMSEDIGFESLLHSAEIETNSYSFNLDYSSDTLFWRIIAYNICLDSTVSEANAIVRMYPSQNSNNKLWYNADNVEIIDNKVAAIYDLSGNDYHAIQTQDVNRPIYINSSIGINNNPSIEFDENTWMKAEFNEPISQPFTTFIIWSINNAHDANVCFQTYNGPSCGLRYYYGVKMSAPDDLYYSKPTSFDFIYNSLIFDGQTSSIFENNLFKVEGNIGNNSLDGITLGAWFDNSYSLDGNIAEIIIYDGLLTQSETYSVNNYLRYKYSQPVNLLYDIRIPYGFCDTAITTAYNPWYISYEWSTGETDSIIHVNKSGLYSVTVTDIFGFESSDDILVISPNVNELTDTVACYGETLVWDLELAGDYLYEWYGSAETGQSLEMITDGQYAAILSDTLGCQYKTDTIIFSIDNYEYTTSIGPADTALCAGNRLMLLSNEDETVSWEWNTSETSSEIVLSTTGEYSVTTTNWHGCEARDTINVTINGVVPVPDFETLGHCAQNPVDFTDLSTSSSGNINSWTWIIDGDEFSTEQNPQLGIENSESGVHEVILAIETDNGCGDFISQDLTIYPLPIISFVPELACANSEIEFTSTSSVGGGSVVNNEWEFYPTDTEPLEVGVGENVTHAFSSEGTHTVQLISTSDAGCTDSTEVEVYVKPASLPVFSTQNTCLGESVYFINQTDYNPVALVQSQEWDFGDGSPTGSETSPLHIYEAAGTFDAELSIRYTNGCELSTVQPVEIYFKPEIELDNLNACVGANYIPDATVSTASGDISTYSWQIGNPVILESTLAEPEIILDQAGKYPVELSVTNSLACSSTYTDTLIVRENPLAAFSASRTWGAVPLWVDFTNTSIGAESYYWQFDTVNFSSAENPYFVFQDSGTYIVELQSINEYGCYDIETMIIKSVVPVMDIILYSLRTELNGNYMTTSVYIINNGTLPVAELNLDLNLGNGKIYRETIENFQSGQVIDYTFSFKPYLPDGKIPKVVCVEAPDPIYGIYTDIDLTNNIVCNTNVENLIVFQPFPNPASDNFICEFITAKTEDVQITLINSLGEIVYDKQFKNNTGYTKTTIDISTLLQGIYYLQVRSSDENKSYKVEVNR